MLHILCFPNRNPLQDFSIIKEYVMIQRALYYSSVAKTCSMLDFCNWQYPRSPTQNSGTFCGISTEIKPWNFPWNFHRKFHRDKFAEHSVEIPQKLNRGTFCGISAGCSVLQWLSERVMLLSDN